MTTTFRKRANTMASLFRPQKAILCLLAMAGGTWQSATGFVMFPLLQSRMSFFSIPSKSACHVLMPRFDRYSSHERSDDGDDHRVMEFLNLEPLAESETRRQRMERDLENRARFVEFGDELWDLRSRMDKLSARLVRAIHEGEDDDEQRMRAKLRDAEQRDPELVYMLELSDMDDALREGRTTDAEQHRENAMAARNVLPQFNLNGLWVGKYGSHGYELINVTYVGDTLIAEKVTGDKNVPRGQISFQIDLNPLSKGRGHSGILQPIQLTDKAAIKWGTKQLPRYAGLGQVAEEGFKNHQWMDGQLIIIGDEYFSFAWIPIEQQIFFGRPSPELALKMLRDQGVTPLRSTFNFDSPPTLDADLNLRKDFVTRCMEKTHEYEDELLEGDGLGCIWHGVETDECYFE